jgi:Phage conserved hypothetical protein BR0599
MTFQAYEDSADKGEPVLLYDFSTGSAHWRYTSADRPITWTAEVYTPIAIEAANIIQGQEIKQKTLKVTVPRDAVIVQQLQTYPPSTDLLLTLYQMHFDDPDGQAIVGWIGRVMSQKQKGSVVELSCEPAYTGIQTTGLRRRWQVNCPHVLYALAGCKLVPSTLAVPAHITSVSTDGFTVTSTDFVPPVAGIGWAGGYIEWDSGDDYLERRTINSAVGFALTLAFGSPDLVAGLAVTAYPGCRHTTADCTFLGNILNYGGDAYVPLKNPMDGNPVY